MLRGTLVSICLSALLCSGCSYLNNEIPSLNLPEPEVSTTAAGAASGAAVGAGLGLVLGSMSGEAGKGLVVGSVAGAATGGLIGRGLQDQEERLEGHRNALAVQQEVIREQGEDIERLRQGAQDGLSSNTHNPFDSGLPRAAEPHAPVAFAPEPTNDLFSESQTQDRQSVTEALLARNASSSSYRRARRQAKPFNLTQGVLPRETSREQARARMKPAVQKVRVESRNLSSIAEIRQDQPKPLQKNEDILVTLDSISPIKTSKADKQIESVSAPAKKAKVQMPAALTETPGVEQSGETGRDEALNEVIGVLPPTQEVTDNTQATAALSDRCSDAAKEAEKARLSPSKSNKLFYFRRAMRLCPDAPEFHLEVGYLYAALGRNDDARIEFDRVVELDPENVEAREQLSLLAQ